MTWRIVGVVVALFLFAFIFVDYHGGCSIDRQPLSLSGNSLQGIADNGEEVELMHGYYSCKSVRRGDVVAYRFGGSSDALAKIVRAVPGDRLALREVDGYWEIIVNGRTLSTSEGVHYRISESRANMLSLYINDYNGRIPENAVLLLGNVASGSFDSTQFGLVGVEDLLGKVVIR